MTFTDNALNSPLAPFIPETLSFHALDGTLCPVDQGVLPEAEWNELCKAVAAFYTRYDVSALERARQEAANEPKSRIAPSVPKDRAGFVYLIQGSRSRYKIGRTINIKSRMSAITLSSAGDVSLVYAFQSKDCHKAELDLHVRFADKRKHGEWFVLSRQDVETIKAIQDYTM